MVESYVQNKGKYKSQDAEDEIEIEEGQDCGSLVQRVGGRWPRRRWNGEGY